MSENKILKVNKRIVFREEGDEALLFNPDTGGVKVLNQTGKFIWSNLDGKTTQEAIIRKMKDSFDIADGEQIKKDLNKFIDDLRALKFLEGDES
jgi:hypothetical protein